MEGSRRKATRGSVDVKKKQKAWNVGIWSSEAEHWELKSKCAKKKKKKEDNLYVP